jgi:hypothetical protein
MYLSNKISPANLNILSPMTLPFLLLFFILIYSSEHYFNLYIEDLRLSVS